jgi:hypothetical protein
MPANHPNLTLASLPTRDHSHDGRCSGRLRILAGVLVREIVCDDCGAVIQTLGPAGVYQIAPVGIAGAA